MFLRYLDQLYRHQRHELGELNDSGLAASLQHVGGVLVDDVVTLRDLQQVLLLHVAQALTGLADHGGIFFLLVNILVLVNVGHFLVTNITGNLNIDININIKKNNIPRTL